MNESSWLAIATLIGQGAIVWYMTNRNTKAIDRLTTIVALQGERVAKMEGRQEVTPIPTRRSKP